MTYPRQAVSAIVGTVILISIGLALLGIVLSYHMGISYYSLECEIEHVQIFEITDSVHWGTVQFVNNGGYTIEEYSIIIHDSTQEYLIKIVTQAEILQHTQTTEELEINQNLSSDGIIIEIKITSDASYSSCSKEAHI